MADRNRELMEQLSDGVMPATVTPWTPDYELATDQLRAHISNLAAVDGLSAMVCNAHAGECKMVDRETKQEVVRIHKEAADGKPVVSGVGGEGSHRTIEQAREAEEAGADALMLHPLELYANGDPREPIEHYRRVADAVDIPLFDFQFPVTMDGAAISLDAHREICSMDEVIAFKEASFDPVRYERTVRALDPISDEFVMLSGNDTFLFHSYHLGAEGALIVYANLIPEMHVEKLRAVKRDDLDRARELRDRMMPLTNFLFRDPQGRAVHRTKKALELIGTFEHSTVMPPQAEISEEATAELEEILADLGEL